MKVLDFKANYYDDTTYNCKWLTFTLCGEIDIEKTFEKVSFLSLIPLNLFPKRIPVPTYLATSGLLEMKLIDGCTLFKRH